MTKYDGEFIFMTKFTRCFDVIETYDTGPTLIRQLHT